MPSLPYAPHRFSIRRKVLLGFGLLLVMFAVIAIISWRSTASFSLTAARVAEAHESLEIQEEARRHLTEMESARRGFLVSADERFMASLEKAQQDIVQNFYSLKNRSQDNPQQLERLERMESLLRRSFGLQNAEVEARQRQSFEAAAKLFAENRNEELPRRIKEVFDEFERVQRKTLAERSQLTKDIASATKLAIVAGALLTFTALIFACSMILRDISARRRAELALAAEHNLMASIMDTMPTHVFLKDAKGRFILDNAAHRRYLGLEDEQSIEGRSVFDYYDSVTAETFQTDDQWVIETGEPIFNRQHLVQREGASRETWLETTKVPLRDTDGRIIGIVGISSDVTARKAAEEQLKRFAGQLERSNAELQNFASVASHDLQEPLRKIQAFADRLKAKCAASLGDQGRDYLNRMENAAQRMQILIQDLLKLSRVTSRAQPFEQCDLNVILAEVLSDLEVAIETKQAKVEVGPLPTIDADPLQMRQLFQNLISNALKFQKPGENPLVEIFSQTFLAIEGTLPNTLPGQAVCEITLRDHGIGFDQKFADQIFVVFQRLHTRTEYEGTGIGLAVCRKITDRHGGQIVAHSVEGEGATFLVTLPVSQPTAETHEPTRSDAHNDPDGR